MTYVRLGFVAMSMELKNASPSQTMTYAQFQKHTSREAAIRKLERIAQSNIEHSHRILKHCTAHDIAFYRFSSRLIPLATHQDLSDWDYMTPLQEYLEDIGTYIEKNNIRVDFHPDHFVIINSPKKEVLAMSAKTLGLHASLLKGMKVDPVHRCVLHVGGMYQDKVTALERFISNWMLLPVDVQEMIMLENDDKSFHINDALYLCEKLGVPLVFDYHHHLANHGETQWETEWARIVDTWKHSPLPLKMHISSPKNDKEFRSHANHVDADMFLRFLRTVKGSVTEMDCMIEAKKKDEALFYLMEDLKHHPDIEIVDGASFFIH
ncbi:UV DNA damage repair endonuclease UvsE [Salibacterium salarium]|uniref:UV DNA damage repair endonuclease UvsE n=1 Tax=Salibacterium salarium TaxID=284579 RepID=A0A3R9QUY1_9BACI|nr:UV DNA damage repair endonuclease UvsE [Salibacterium salarium]RSL33996.1 UV DNA damage repair endonuclease UvsE [Salibacterium salarium]